VSYPAVTPLPPVVTSPIPWLRAGYDLLEDATSFLKAQRELWGDTFVVDACGYRLFFVFDAPGVAALYAAEEDRASFGLATYELVFRRKIPNELALGRRNRPHDLFKNPDVEGYLEQLERAVEIEIAELGQRGVFECFALAKRLGYRLGLASWAGVEAASPERLPALIEAFERLDTADSFVRPHSLLWSALTRKRGERRAMHAIERALGEILDARRTNGAPRGDFLERIDASWADLPPPERNVQVARDVMLIQMGAQSNLPAALAWTLANLLLNPPLLEAVRDGDDALIERCASESIRCAQRSLTLRRVVRPFEIETGAGRFTLAPGVLLATMLSVTNRSAAAGLEPFDPGNYSGRKLVEPVAKRLPARELVSTFGHGRHSCPAQRFSISAIRIAVRRLVDRFELEPRFAIARPRARQLGGIARCDNACNVDYRVRGQPRYPTPEALAQGADETGS
jgi:cytochrome P450